MSDRPIIIWLRNDLRLKDQPCFFEAAKRKKAIIPVYIYAPEEEGKWPFGAAAQWWLHHSLQSLKKDLKEQGVNLIIRKGNSLHQIEDLIKKSNAEAVFWTRRYEPYAIERDTKVKSALKNLNVEAISFNGQLLYEPWTISNKQGKPFQVFTPFYNHCLSLQPPREPISITKLIPCKNRIESLSIEALKLLPKIHWDKGLQERWTPGENAAHSMLNQFLKNSISNYVATRDFPALEQGVSHLSPYLHFGEISPYQIWHAAKDKKNTEIYLRQLIWREFAHHLLYHFPFMPEKPLKENFKKFPWNYDNELLTKWQKGRTGYPIVDAGMRELWKTGWMHNRVRMIVGSFLVKDLLLPWQEGEKWFWDTLVDADMANNCFGWQWVAGSGADAAPYFRIFNPITQSEKFDPEGEYIRKYIPELKALSNEWIHRPWEAPPLILKQAAITLGKDYPEPCVDHQKARERALQAFSRVKTN